MSFRQAIRGLIAACACWSVVSLCPAADAPASATGLQRDGQHDFDFNLGVWKTQIRRNIKPLTDRPEFVDLSGTVRVRPVWNGKALLEEIDADGPQGHWQGMTLFLYNPKTRQWNQSFANSARGNLDSTFVGSYTSGRMEMYMQDSLDGRSILARGTWSDITPDSHSYREDYSADGGKTWELAFSARLTRQSADPGSPTARDRSHDFDFQMGAWRAHSRRLLRPLTGSRGWVDVDGITVVTPIWGGRGNLVEYKADGPGGVELLAIRLYDPRSGQWNNNFATADRGTLDAPGYGEFHDGRIDFYDQEMVSGRAVLVRFSLWPVDRDSARSEQAFSADGGRTWEVNWKTEYTREQGASASR